MPLSPRALAPLRVIDHDLLGGTSVLSRDATTLFVDLVGFTPLTDQLGKFGSRGTEQLSDVLQAFFGSVTEQALSRGGDPVAYGGDALTIVFDGDARSTLAAAQELASSIHRLTVETNGTATLAGPLSLQTRIGIARGAVATSVIRANSRSLPLQLGVGLDRAAAAESKAAVGQVVCDASTVNLDAPAKSAISTGAPARSLDAPLSMDPDELARLVHPTVLRHLLADSSLWQSHRTATAAFIGFPSVPADEIRDFAGTVAQLMRQVDDCGGEVVQVSGGDKGVVALVVFGAPVGHDDDPLRALRAVLEFRRVDPSVRVGLTTGPVFATWLGSEHRRFQAHFGGALNIAARLMQASQPREVLVDGTTWRAASAYLRQHGGPQQITVKGQSEPIEVRHVAGWRRRRRPPPPPTTTILVGREPESDLIERLLDRIQTGRGVAQTLVGDPGIGKSRLAREAADRARARGMQVIDVDIGDYPYGEMAGLWREIIGHQLGIDPSAKRKDWHAALRERMPSQTAHLDVLSPLLGISAGSQDVALAIEPGLAVELAQSLVARLVVETPAGDPTLIVIENAQHLPPVSRALLNYLQHRVGASAVGLLVTERIQPGVGTDPERGGSTRQVGELSEVASAALVEDTWRQSGGGSPPPWLAAQVFRQAGGNPLFLRTATLRMRSVWRPGDPPPDDRRRDDGSLASALTERIDMLDADQRQVLAVLAVAQRPVRMGTPIELLASHVASTAVKESVQLLLEGDLVRLVPSPDGERYAIRHALLQQLIYEQMTHADRTRRHRAMSELLIRQDAAPGEIADHVRQLDDLTLGRTWYPLAAAEARRSWSVNSAIEWWRMALPLLEGPSRVEAEVELSELLLVGGRPAEVLEAAGEPTEPTHVLAVGDSATDADSLLLRRLVVVAEAALSCGDFARCEAQCMKVMAFTDGRDEGRYQTAAELLVRSMCDRGSMTEAVALARTYLTRAEGSGDPTHLTTANASLGAALLFNGEPSAAARHYEAALENALSTGDVIHRIHVLSDLAGCAYAVDDYPRCLTLLEQARALADSVGYRRHLMYSLNNEAQLRAGLGDGYAAVCTRLATARAVELGDLALAANAIHTWLTSDAKLIADVQAWQRLALLNQHLGRTLDVADCNANLAVAAARRGDAGSVETAAQDVRSHPEITPGSELDRRVELATTLLAASMAPNAADGERLTLAQHLEKLSTLGDVSEVARAELLVSAWQIAPESARHARAVDASRAAFVAEPSAVVRAWFHDLGVTEPADHHRLPPPIGISDEAAGPAELEAALSALETAVDARSRR